MPVSKSASEAGSGTAVTTAKPPLPVPASYACATTHSFSRSASGVIHRATYVGVDRTTCAPILVERTIARCPDSSDARIVVAKVWVLVYRSTSPRAQRVRPVLISFPGPRHHQMMSKTIATLSVREVHRLLDHLIRPLQQRRRDRQAEGLGGLEVDHQLELRGLLDGKVARLGSLEDLVHVGSGAAKLIRQAGPIRHEAATLGVLPSRKDGGQPALRREFPYSMALTDEHGVCEDHNPLGPLSSNGRKRAFKVLGCARLDDLKLQTQFAGCGRGLVQEKS